MNLLSTIKAKLKKKPHKEVILIMGYQAVEKGEKSINAFLRSENLYDWLSSGHYDYKYTAEQFFVKLSAAINMDPKIVKSELGFYEKTVKEYERYEDVYIFVNTNFKRASQPIFTLALMESFRLILPDKESLIFKSDKDVLDIISDFVASHYKVNKGELNIWGKIDNYIYHHNDDKTYTFDKKGKLFKDAPKIFEDHASIQL
ncbi:MAG: hypothetical protein QF453_03980 [Candidatus Marinimicrobia bacterium]|jgi:uncharacterized protein (DUF2132 family)|nr:hypothetical protein [Candidatus Neomarinimicrobiota bacterium]|tara:strand:- start:300 stop:905 length:606 start_codon:yes stop_codon:yes gene_type:complete